MPFSARRIGVGGVVGVASLALVVGPTAVLSPAQAIHSEDDLLVFTGEPLDLSGSDLYTSPVGAGLPTTVLEGGDYSTPRLSPDGELVAVTSYDVDADTSVVVVSDLEGDVLWTSEPDVGISHYSPSWADSQNLLYEVSVDGDDDYLEVVDLETEDTFEVDNSVDLHDPSMTPDGSAVVAVDGNTESLVRLELGSGLRLPLPGTGGAFGPAVSPDGSSIAFTRVNFGPNDDDFFFDLVVAPACGGPTKTLDAPYGFIDDIAWSPIGDRIYMAAYSIDEEKSDIWATTMWSDAELVRDTDDVEEYGVSVRNPESASVKTVSCPVRADFSGDALPDLVTRDTTGRLFLYPSNGSGGFKSRVVYGTGWNAMTAIVHPGDWDGDGRNDVLARDTTGRLYLYPGNGSGGFGVRVAFGTGWNVMTAILGPGDVDDDGIDDLIARDTAGKLWAYPGDGEGGFKPRALISSGWNGLNALVTPGDWDGDGCADLLARDAAGRLWLFAGTETVAFAPAVQVGNGWNTMTAIVGPGDWDRDGRNDILARDASGRLFLYRGNGSGGFKQKVAYGTGWNAMTAIVA